MVLLLVVGSVNYWYTGKQIAKFIDTDRKMDWHVGLYPFDLLVCFFALSRDNTRRWIGTNQKVVRRIRVACIAGLGVFAISFTRFVRS